MARLRPGAAAGRAGTAGAEWRWQDHADEWVRARRATRHQRCCTPRSGRCTGKFPAVWVAGVLRAAATSGGLASRLIAAGDSARLGPWTVCALFVPSLALAHGAWSGTSKAFEGSVCGLVVRWAGESPARHGFSGDDGGVEQSSAVLDDGSGFGGSGVSGTQCQAGIPLSTGRKLECRVYQLQSRRRLLTTNYGLPAD